jgi:hypothetical protein
LQPRNLPSYLLHLISCSLHCQSLIELSSLLVQSFKVRI